MPSVRREEERRLKGFPAELLEWVEAIGIALAIVVLVFTFALRIVSVDGDSMNPTLSEEDRILVSSLFYTPESGDVVIIAAPSGGDGENIPLVKRIIATGGQTVDIVDGYVYVDGVQRIEAFERIDDDKLGDIQYPVTVPQGCVYVLGDNRNDSLDSRSSGVGMIDENYILGKALYRLYPFSDFGSLYGN